MSDVVLVQKLAPEDLRAKATGPGWWPWRAKDAEFDGFVLLRCWCNTTAALDDHAIAADGTVTPSILCGECGWHVMGRLEGWTFGVREPRGR